MSPSTVAVCEPHTLMLETLVTHIESGGYAVVGQAATLHEAPRMLESHKPDILVFGVEGAAADVSALKLLRRFGDDLRVLVYGPDRAEVIAESFRAGADAYLVRGALDDLGAALKQLDHRTVYLAEPVRSSIPAGASNRSGSGLTKKESELLAQLASSGATTTELAAALGVTEQTVKFHLTNIFKKLKVKNRAEAMLWARQNGLV